jgi:putative flippase GtrA
LVAPLISGHSEVAIGTRLGAGARVQRGLKREFISRCYNLILRTALRARFSDAQCGFKAIRHDAAARLLPMVEDGSWFFDTELLVLAQRCGMRIHEVPVDWVDDPDSRVDIVPTAIADLKGVARLLRAPRLVRFAGVGVASTLVYLLLFALGRTFLGAQAANLVALLASALGNTATNRRFTFGVRGSTHAVRHHVQGLLLFLAGLALTGGALQLLTRLDPRAPGCRAHRTGGGQRRGHRPAVPGFAAVGVPARPGELRQGPTSAGGGASISAGGRFRAHSFVVMMGGSWTTPRRTIDSRRNRGAVPVVDLW